MRINLNYFTLVLNSQDKLATASDGDVLNEYADWESLDSRQGNQVYFAFLMSVC
jgi:hypothetical protein